MLTVIVAIYVAFNVLASLPTDSSVRIDVDAGKLPVTCEVLRARVTLQRVTWTGSRAYFQWTVDGGPTPVELDEHKIVFDGKEFNRRLYYVTCETHRLDPNRNDVTTDIGPPRGAKRFDLSQAFHVSAKSKNARFRFPSLDPSLLPVSKRIGSATVTLRSIAIEKLGTKSWSMCRPPFDQVPRDRQFVVLQADISVPGYYSFEGRISDKATSSESSWDESEQSFDVVKSNPVLRAAGGPGPGVVAVAYTTDMLSDAPAAFKRESDRRTPAERMVGIVSLPTASRMITHRGMVAANAAKSSMHVRFAFPINSVPKRMDFEMSVQLPPDQKERALIVFKNAPVR